MKFWFVKLFLVHITNGNACFVCDWVRLKDSLCTTDNITFVVDYIFTIKTVLVYQKKKTKFHYNMLI